MVKYIDSFDNQINFRVAAGKNMPIIECTECKGQVSSQAKTCPHCGVKVPQQIGLGGLLAVFFVGWLVYQVATVDSASTSSTANSDSDSSSTANEVTSTTPEKPKSSWTTSESVDEMTGKKEVYALSERIMPTRPMKHPYSRVKAWIGVGCDKSSEWAFFGFDQSPNLAGSETKSGYSIINTRIKWDSNIANTQLNQEWGSSFIHFENTRAAIAKIAASSSVMLELNWYSSGVTNFIFPMNGSSEAIAEMRSKCKT